MKKLVGIREVEQFPIYDLTVKDDHCFELGNGVVAHNSMFPKTVIPGGCVAGGTKIVMSDNKLKCIEDITVGDHVMTLTGPEAVTVTWDSETLEDGTPECIELQFDDGYTCVVSDKHKFLVSIDDKFEWVKAKDLTEDMDIVKLHAAHSSKIVSKKNVGRLPVFDLTIGNKAQYALENGVVSHNTAVTYAPNTIFVIGKSQDKGSDGELNGWNFTLNVHKSRYVREKSKFPFNVSYEEGIRKYSGMLDMAIELGAVVSPSSGWYSSVDLTTGEIDPKKWRKKDLDVPEFWDPILSSTEFQTKIAKRYKLEASMDTGQIEIIIEDEDD